MSQWCCFPVLLGEPAGDTEMCSLGMGERLPQAASDTTHRGALWSQFHTQKKKVSPLHLISIESLGHATIFKIKYIILIKPQVKVTQSLFKKVWWLELDVLHSLNPLNSRSPVVVPCGEV